MAIAMERQTVVTSANWVLGPKQGNWTYHHYAALPDDGQRYEIIDGVLLITPAPGIAHQKTAQRIFRLLNAYASPGILSGQTPLLSRIVPTTSEIAADKIFA